MNKKYLFDLNDRVVYNKGGSKARNLSFLLRNKFLVPPGWALSYDAFNDYKVDGDIVIEKISKELSESVNSEKYYAVRSSASVEDGSKCSCAGLFRSFLFVRGTQQLIGRIKDVWDSLESLEFLAYCRQNSVFLESAKMAVIIQEMVPAVYSGVAFSKNPLTGLSEMNLFQAIMKNRKWYW